jgi:hypothetical protein
LRHARAEAAERGTLGSRQGGRGIVGRHGGENAAPPSVAEAGSGDPANPASGSVTRFDARGPCRGPS